MARLVVINKPVAVKEFELGERWSTIGRAGSNTFQIIEPSVSGRHCEVQAKGNELAVRDLRSTNGTFISGHKVAEGVVKLGQTFRLGDVELRFEASVQVVAKTPAPAAATPAPTAKPTATPVATQVVSAPKPIAPVVPPPKPSIVPAPKSSDAGGETIRKFQVLFVDDSLAFLETFAALCDELSGGRWQIHATTSADRALAVLQDQTIDLAVLDIGMPMLDGIQLLAIISRRYPGLKTAILTGMANDANRTACLAHGAELFLEKPVSPDGIKLAFNMLNDILLWGHQKGFSGALRQVGLPDVIQMECLNGKSVILEVRNGQVHGQIFIESGKIIHAATGQLTGEKAFHELLALNGGQFHFHPFTAPPKRTVSGQWEFLLMDAARARDEKNDKNEKAAALASVPAPALAPSIVVASPTAAVPPASSLAKPGNGNALPPAVGTAPVPVKSGPGKPAGSGNVSEDPTRFIAQGENIVVVDGKEEKWLSMGPVSSPQPSKK